MADNKLIKDGIGDTFTLRMRDISAGGDGSIQRSMLFATPYPLDYGTGGIYQHCAKSGVIAAGLAANAPIYSFQWPATLLALINRVRINAWTNVGFAAGVATFDMFIARGFTVADGGGNEANLVGGGGRLRTSMANSQAIIMCATTAALTPGTRTLDPDAVDTRVAAAPTTGNTPLFPSAVTLFEKLQGEHPLFLAPDEGFVIRASVPGTGTWQFKVTTEWDEVVLF
jgi:hypothetical protein